MKRFSIMLLVCAALAPASAQARNFSDLRTDVAATPYRVGAAVAAFHPVASLTASMRRGMASWDEWVMRLQDIAVIGRARLTLGADEVRASVDRGLLAMIGRLFAGPVPSAGVPAAIGTAAPAAAPSFDGAGARWLDEVERLFRASP